ncbi:MAG: hypothetical protein J5616_07690 [Bacteroidaceae bacterium]|nr:hypothetical protein [Bacteroidaceae bacterium]
MRKTKLFWMLAAILTFCGAMTLTSCSDKDDNSNNGSEERGGGGEGQVETWIYDQHMNKSILPGDNFFMYCNGGYWDKTEVGDVGPESLQGYQDNEYEAYESRYKEGLEYPMMQRIYEDIRNTNATTRDADEQLIQDALDRIDAAQNADELWTTVGQLWAEGYSVPFEMNFFCLDGKIFTSIIIDESAMGGDDEEEEGEGGEEGDEAEGGSESFQMLLLKHPEVVAGMRPLMRQSTRAFSGEEWPMLVSMLTPLGIDLNNVYVANPNAGEDIINFVLNGFGIMQSTAEMDVNEAKGDIKKFIQKDLNYSDDEAIDLAKKMGITMLELPLGKYFSYEKAKAYADKNVTAEMQARTQDYLEELREAFRSRLADSKWMSAGSKAVMIDKLNKMTFFAGKPDKWIDETPDFSGSTGVVDDLLRVRKARLAMQKKLIGMDKDEASFHILVGFTNDGNLQELNACYMSYYNSLYVFPAWMMEPFYSGKNEDAVNYSTLTVFAHEITHGFDAGGAQFDAVGNVVEEGIWATPDDAQKFEELTQLLVNSYSVFEVMPDELHGLHNDGVFTLNENIADLGGFEIAYTAFVKHLEGKGVSGDELAKQKRHFYQAYANLWRCKYSVTFAQGKTDGDETSKDNHSLSKERINGVVSNTDDWYDLFNVKEGQKLYLPLNKRAHIW